MRKIEPKNIGRALALLCTKTTPYIHRDEDLNKTYMLMPMDYADLSDDKRNEMWSEWGCGPGGIGDRFVPDTLWGLSITHA